MLIEHLLQIGYNYQGDSLSTMERTILDNSNFVGDNCLTFITETSAGKTRFKIYNKFVQSCESPSVRGRIGHHIKDWINNPEKELQQASPASIPYGLLRLKITFYRKEYKCKNLKKCLCQSNFIIIRYKHNGLYCARK
jgi:hypothetical protein